MITSCSIQRTFRVTCLCLLLAGPNGNRLSLAASGVGSALPPEQLRQKYGLFVH